MNIVTKSLPEHIPEDRVFGYDFRGDPEFLKDPINAQTTLMKDAPDIFFSPLYGGFWTVKNINLVRELCQQPESFSNYPAAIPALQGHTRKMAPIEIDPPELNRYRFTLAPALAPPKARDLEPTIRDYAVRLIDDFAKDGKVDFVTQFATIFPVQIFLLLVNVSEEHLPEIRDLHDTFMSGAENPQAAMAAGQKLEKLYAQLVQDRKQNLGDDLISNYISATPQGGAFTDEEVTAGVLQLFVAGIDTVAMSMSLSWKLLAENAELREAIRKEPSVVPTAIDELMRYTSLISATRTVRHDLEFDGVKMKEGDRILLPLNISNRDAEEFPNPDQIDLDRKRNSNIAFGAGPHRCVGSHVARVEFRVVLEEWFKRIPEFTIDPSGEVVGRGGHALGLKSLPLKWEI